MSTSSGTVEFSSIAILWGADDIWVETLEAKSSDQTIHGLQTISSIVILGGADNGAKIVSAVVVTSLRCNTIIWSTWNYNKKTHKVTQYQDMINAK